MAKTNEHQEKGMIYMYYYMVIIEHDNTQETSRLRHECYHNHVKYIQNVLKLYVIYPRKIIL